MAKHEIPMPVFTLSEVAEMLQTAATKGAEAMESREMFGVSGLIGVEVAVEMTRQLMFPSV